MKILASVCYQKGDAQFCVPLVVTLDEDSCKYCDWAKLAFILISFLTSRQEDQLYLQHITQVGTVGNSSLVLEQYSNQPLLVLNFRTLTEHWVEAFNSELPYYRIACCCVGFLNFQRRKEDLSLGKEWDECTSRSVKFCVPLFVFLFSFCFLFPTLQSISLNFTCFLPIFR